jgi:hypothetical protein
VSKANPAYRAALRVTVRLQKVSNPDILSLPEGRLIFAVIAQTVDDLLGLSPDPSPLTVQDALEFLVSPAWGDVCSALRLDPDIARGIIRKHVRALNPEVHF